LRDGTWQNNTLKIPIDVVPPIYLQTWFIILSCFLILMCIIAFIKYKTRKLLKDKDYLEKSVVKRTEQLNNLLKEKEVHLKEIHHRVKNNLQIISGLLEIQNKKASANESALLNESINRIHSIALIHKNLYEFEDMSHIDLRIFVNDLYKQIQNALLREEKLVKVNIAIPEKMYLDIDTAVPLGLILNELITNSCKYAITNNLNPAIAITIKLIKEGHFELQYNDNGPGLPVEFNLNKTTSMGMQLIKDLSRQIKGTIIYENKKGAFFTIHFTNIDERKKQD
jgi:two-component sensor histidine kinase